MPTPGVILRQPFVSVAGFKAHPTFLDLQNLRSLDPSPADQDEQLLAILLEASETAQGGSLCNQPLQGHLVTQYGQGRTDKWGRLSIHADDGPVRRLVSLSYGVSIGTAVTVTSPSYRVVDNIQIQVELANSGLSWSGALQLGPPSAAVELLTTAVYVAGFANSVLTATANAATSTLTVADPTGIEPGDILRVWDPGASEQVQVTAGYTPVPSTIPAATAIPLVTPLVSQHLAGVHVSGLPSDAYTAVVYLAIDMLQKPGTSSPNWPGGRSRAATAKNDPPSSVYWNRAKNLLRPYMAVR